MLVMRSFGFHPPFFKADGSVVADLVFTVGDLAAHDVDPSATGQKQAAQREEDPYRKFAEYRGPAGHDWIEGFNNQSWPSNHGFAFSL